MIIRPNGSARMIVDAGSGFYHDLGTVVNGTLTTTQANISLCSPHYIDHEYKTSEIEEINEEVLIGEKLTCYPNPTNGRFYIEDLTFDAIIEVLSLDGKSVLSKRIVGSGNTVELDLRNLLCGIYIARISGLEEVYNIKIFKL